MRIAWYTKSMKNIEPVRFIHYSEDGNDTICGVKINGPRWYIENMGVRSVTCKKCLMNFDIDEYINNHPIYLDRKALKLYNQGS